MVQDIIKSQLDALEVSNELVYSEEDSLIDNGLLAEEDLGCDELQRTNDVLWAHGVSKLVLLDVEPGKVYKIPFTTLSWYSWDPDTDGYKQEKGPYSTNYCDLELQLYKAAVEAGIAKVFPKTEYVGVVNGLQVYSAEAADYFHPTDTPSETLRSHLTNQETEQLDFFEMDFEILDTFLEYYGYDFLLKVDHFLKDNGINDIRTNNLGIIDGRPVIIDFSGFDNF